MQFMSHHSSVALLVLETYFEHAPGDGAGVVVGADVGGEAVVLGGEGVGDAVVLAGGEAVVLGGAAVVGAFVELGAGVVLGLSPPPEATILMSAQFCVAMARV